MSKQYLNFLTRSIVVLGLVAGSNSLGLSPLLAAPTAPNTIIDNQATGTFTDGEDTSAVPEPIVSNVVSVTVAEVAGITVTASTPSEAPVAVTGAGALQGNGSINAGDIAYFDFVITNTGNDSTQFFIPGAPSITGSATFDAATNPIEIISYNPTGTADIPVIGATVSAGGQATGPSTATGTDGLLGKNGIIPVGGSVKIRVPVKVATSAIVGSNISVRMGNTPSDTQNQVYSANGISDIYTQDNPDNTTNAAGTVVETTGLPFNGDSLNHRQEASATSSTDVIAEPISISGTVFEDVNYGGGAGRSLTDATGVARNNVRVEIYDTTGNYLAATVTDANGKYKFNELNATSAFTASKNYYIRVVNNTVTSSRLGAVLTLLPVQTFRTDVSTGNVTAVTDRVGGENPAVADKGAAASGDALNTSNFTFTSFNEVAGGQAESVTKVTLGTTAVADVDFGYNFDTIVNTNTTGQGSLDQFITNSNTLQGEATLAQTNQVPGKETSVFMISDGLAHSGLRAGLPNLLATSGANKGAAVIRPTLHYVISDSNTSLDGRTQSANIGNTNTGSPIGTGGTVGVDALTLDKVPRPEIVIDFSAVPVNTNGIQVTGANALLAGLAVYGYHPFQNVAVTPLMGMIYVLPAVPDSGKTTITQLLVGTSADGTEPSIPLPRGAGIVTQGGTVMTNNYIAYNGDGIYFSNQNGTSANATNNEVTQNGPKDNSSSEASGDYADNIETDNNTTNFTLRGNFIHDPSSPPSISANTQGQGLQISTGSSNGIVDNNTFDRNRRFGINSAGNDITITKNIVKNTVSIPAAPTQGSGININDGMLRNRISQNSLYDNLTLGINLSTAGVTPNDGTVVATKANNGMDYPIIQSSSISGNTLTIKGYVGTPTTSSTFAGATLEFFVGAADTNDKGKVFSSDPSTVSKLHAEGQTYLGTCAADANGKFNCPITVPTGTDPKTITSTATDAAGNTSEFSSSVSNPNVLLVKRITAINGITNTTSGDNLASYIQEESNPYDDNVIETTLAPSNNFPTPDTTYWPDTTGKTSSNFLLGGINGGNIKPKDTIEYTIYFLSTGDSPAENVMFCDRVPSNTTFFPTAFNSTTPQAPGGVNDSRGIFAKINGTESSYTNVGDGDAARYIPAGTIPKDANNKDINCGGPNDNGAVVFNLGNIPNATAPNTPGSYGFVRFQGRVK